ncbi:MAG TPA: hypothetical protein VM822_26155, partial [Pseudolabrys sp.]|nr:hypothetical protein [Pseudolabrys sp.]
MQRGRAKLRRIQPAQRKDDGGQSVHLGPTAGHLHREELSIKGKAIMTSITVPHNLILERIL